MQVGAVSQEVASKREVHAIIHLYQSATISESVGNKGFAFALSLPV